ncbi:MAG: choice-of-anchor L domain-containing protein, partial [Flavobacteriales bacterium]
MAVLLLFGGKAYSQITCAQTTINNYVANICGPGITFSNVTLTGDANSIAQFGGGISGGLGATMNTGIVMSTGYVNTATALNGPAGNFSSTAVGTAGVAQLNTIAGATTNDGIILEFDFVPITNQINVNFQFGSEEYNEYVNSGFNDAFAFLISGPGIVGSPNIAVVPGVGTPVTIDNINRGNAFGCGGGCTNCAYYNDNCNGTFNNIMDGFTTMLTATRTVIPCSTYHIRLMLADGGDSSYDSWVFVQENGLFAAGNPPLTTTATYPFGASTFEECNNSYLTFTIPTAQVNPYSFNVTWTGTATSGVDYTPLPTTITIPAGQTTVNIPITVLSDNIAEGTESIICTYPYSVCSTAVVTMYIADSQPMTANAGPDQGICAGASVTLTASSTNGNGTITYTWNNGGGTGQSITVSPAATTTYTVTATDQCGRTATDQVTVTVSPPPTSTFTVTSPVCQGQNATVTYTGTAPAGATYTWNFGGANIVSGSGAGPYVLNWTNAGFPNVSLIVASGSCSSAVTTNPVTVNPNPTVNAGNDLVICQGTQVTVNGTGPAGISESWSNGISEGVPFTPPVGVNTYTYTGTVTATGCSASDQVMVTVNPNPVVNAGPDQTVCQGTAVTLAGSGASFYTWPAPVTNNTPVVLAPGVYTITMVGTDANTCQGTDQVIVTVTPTPAAPVLNSNSPLCSGTTLNLMASTGTGISWSGPNGFTSAVQNPTIPNVTTAASGNYSAYVVVSGCTSATTNLNVTVNPTPATPVLGSNSPVCSGQTLNLTSNVATGMNWTGPNGFTSTVQNPNIANVTTAASGTYSAYTVAAGCTSATATVNVTVNPTPANPVAGGNSPLCSGATLNLTSTAASGNNWTGPNGFTSTAQNPTITNVTTAASGTYSVYAAALGCTSATATVTIVVNPTPATPVLGSNSPVCSG